MLDQAMKNQLRQYLGNLKQALEVRLNLDDSDRSAELKGLAEDISELSSLVTVIEDRDDSSRRPLMTISNEATGTRLAFAGVPLGHEFTSLVLALLHSGGHPIKEEVSLQERIRKLEARLDFEIYVSLGCQTCPEVVQALNVMAALNPQVTTTMIDGEAFQDEVSDRNIMAVPTVYLNGKKFSQGRLRLEDILRKVDTAGSQAEAAALSERAPYDMLIVGGGPAGASAAVYAARKGLRTGIVAESFGGQVLDTLGIENFISVRETEGPKLVASLEEHVKQYDVDILEGQLAADVTARDDKGLHSVTLKSGATLKARSVLLATGARWRQLGVPGENEYTGHGVAYCPHCDGPLFKGKQVAVVGGGNSGIEAAIDLAGVVEHVTVLEYADSLKADQVLVDKARSMPNIDILTSAQTLRIEGDGERVETLVYRNREDNSEHSLALAGVFVQIGLIPNSDFVRERLETNAMGEIVVGPRGETSLPGVFAAGDVTTVAYKQIIIAMGAGANAALGAFDHLIRSPHVAEAA